MTEQLEFKTYLYQNTGAVYEGTFMGKLRHGRGHWKHPNGELFEGEYQHNKQNGKGIYMFGATGKMYAGDWLDGQMDGTGIYFFNATRTTYYVGGYAKEKKHGSGYYMYESGVMTVQKWNHGELTDEAESTVVDRIACAAQLHSILQEVRHVAPKEMGDWPKQLSRKRFEFESGGTYDGEFIGNKKHGQGHWMHPDGDYYEGQFFDNRHDGWGVYFSATTGKHYVGQWQNGLMNGWGVYFFSPNEDEFFIGTYTEDKKDGRGLYKFATGQMRFQLWRMGELVECVEANPTVVQTHMAGVKKLLSVVAPFAPHFTPKIQQ